MSLLLLLSDDGPWGNTYYVSNQAANGYPVGNDATGNGTISAPYATIDKAISVAASNDRIVVNGDNHASAANGYLLVSKPLWFFAVGTVTFTSTNATRTVYVNHNFGGKTFFNNFIFDANATSNYSLQLAAPATQYNVVMNNCRLINAKQRGVSSLGSIKVNIQLSGVTISSAAMTESAILMSAVSAGNININNLELNVSGLNLTQRGGVFINANSTGVKCTVAGVTGSVTSNAALSGMLVGVKIENIEDARIENCSNLSLVSASASCNCALYWITASTAGTLGANRGKILDCTGTVDSLSSGYFALIGQDAVNAAQNRSNDGEIARCTISGVAANAAAGIHGIMLGRCTGGTAHDNHVEYAGIAYISKYNNGTFYDNYSRYAKDQHLRAKASQGVFENNECIADVGYAATLMMATEDNVDTSQDSDATFNGNTLTINGGTPVTLSVDADSTASMDSNVYIGNHTNWTYQGVTYANFAAWEAAGIETNPIQG